MKTFIFIFSSIYLFLFGIYQMLTLSVVAGHTEGSFQVNEAGASTYHIPVRMPAGTAGIEPKLALTYSSQGGDGLVGDGWSLQGLSVICRGLKTVAQDGTVKGVDLSGTDVYSLDGERLVPIQGLNGADSTEYRTEQNAFHKIKSFGNVNASPEKYKRWTGEGLFYEYGYTANARTEAQGSASVLCWHVNKVQDTKGNYYTVEYQEDNATGETYPIRLRYTGNDAANLIPYASVELTYENRIKTSRQYISGSLSSASKRLSKITTKYGSTIFREYNLTYAANKDRLLQIQECAANGDCFKPTRFEWAPENNFGLTEQPMNRLPAGDLTGGDANLLLSGDWNGDGQADFMRFNVLQGWNKWFFNTNRFEYTQRVQDNVIPFNDIRLKAFAPNDFNSDGFGDFLVYDPTNGGGTQFYINQRNTNTLQFNRFNNLIPNIPPNRLIESADFNGDGLPDLLVRAENGQTQLYLNRFTPNNGLSFEAVATNLNPNWLSGSFNNDPVTWSIGDFNGDRLADICWYYKPHGGNRWFINQGNNTFLHLWDLIPSAQIAGGNGIAISDFNADDMPDVFWYDPNNGNTRFFTNLGNNSFQLATQQLPAHLITGANGILSAVDFNGDNTEDLMFYHPASGTNRWFANDGNLNFTRPLNPLNTNEAGFSNPIAPNLIVNAKLQMGTFGRKGIVDALFYNTTDGTNRWFENNVIVNSMIKSITDGQGARFDIDYGYLTDNDLYIKENNPDFPTVDFQGRYPVVRSYRGDNGVGSSNKVNYFYKGAKINLQGRGFRGFTEVTFQDSVTGNIQKQFFNRDYRYISAPLQRSETRLRNGTLISETENQDTVLKFYDGNPKVHFSYTKQSITKSYEITGALYQTVRTWELKDDYGNTTHHVVDYGDGNKDSTVNTYSNPIIGGQWMLGRLQQAIVYRWVSGQPQVVKKAAFEYDLTTGLLTKEIFAPDSSERVRVEKTYVHNGIGNIIESRVKAHNGVSVEERVRRTTFDANGRFTVSVVNELGQTVETNVYNNTLGVQTSATNANGNAVNHEYDGFGRLTRSILPDGNWTTMTYLDALSGNSPPLAVYAIRQDYSNQPSATTYMDKLGREIRRQTTNLDGRTIFIDKVYNERGQVVQTSEPYFVGDTPLWTTMEYDLLDRETRQIAPGNRISTMAYNGLTAVVVNPLGQRKTSVKNALQRLTQVIDNQGNPLNYGYDAAGNQTSMTDANGNVTRLEYDILGRKILMNDPNLGITRYEYNGFDELLKEIDAKGQVTEFRYDKLGRILQRIENEGITNWTYDSGNRGIGKLTQVTTSTGYSQSFQYDNLERVISLTETIENQPYTYWNAYNAQGQLTKVTYPSGFRIKNVYNSFGYLVEVRNDSTNELYWRVDSANAKGQVLKQQLGSRLTTRMAYDPTTHLVQSIQTSDGQFLRQSLSFQFNAVGSLTRRRQELRGLQEDFLYDNLNRMTEARILNRTPLTMRYDKLGNITFKSDVGTYHYGSARPHAVTHVDLVSDTVCIPSMMVNMAYTSFDKVRSLKQASDSLQIGYGANYQRIVQKTYLNGSLRHTRIHVGGLYEKEILPDEMKETHYIKVGSETIGVYTRSNVNPSLTRFWLKDHLGSLHVVTDSIGQVLEELSYDAWGKRRNADWTPMRQQVVSVLFARGFTGHEHLDLFGLINMNGRVFDPVLGRFLSADPFIQDPTDLQNLNRYSYLMNNPLSGTDPSGYFFKFLKKFFKSVAKIAIGVVIGFVIMATIGGAFAGLAYSIVSAAAYGFGGGFANTLLSGGGLGNAFKNGFKAAVMAAANKATSAAMSPSLIKSLKEPAQKAESMKKYGDIYRQVWQGMKYSDAAIRKALNVHESLGYTRLVGAEIMLPFYIYKYATDTAIWIWARIFTKNVINTTTCFDNDDCYFVTGKRKLIFSVKSRLLDAGNLEWLHESAFLIKNGKAVGSIGLDLGGIFYSENIKDYQLSSERLDF
jgi:RHS repeat-associated protein